MHWMACEAAAPDSGELLRLMLEDDLRIISEGRVLADELFSRYPDSAILKLCFDLIGTSGAIDVTRSSRNVGDRIDVYDSYRYSVRPSIDIGNYVRHSSRIMLVDGFVDNVSEIHRMLHKASEDKFSVLVFARGFSPDVLNTLSVNFSRKTLDVVPFSIPLDETTVNDMFDLGLISGAEVISSTKGQLISEAKYENFPVVSHVKYTQDGILVMRNENTSHQVRDHVTKLRSRLEKADNFNSPSLLRRIKNMTSLVAVVSLSNTIEFESRASTLRRSVRSVEHMLTYGYVVTDRGLRFPKSSYEVARKHHEDLLRIGDPITLNF